MAKVSSSSPRSSAPSRKASAPKKTSAPPKKANAPSNASASKPPKAAPPKDTARVSPEAAKAPWPDPASPSPHVQALNNAWGQTPATPPTSPPPKVTYRWGEPLPVSETSKQVKRLAQLGDTVQATGDFIAKAGEGGSKILKDHVVKPGMDWVDRKLKDTPGREYTQHITDYHRGIANGVAGTPEAIGQAVGHPVETVKNVWNAVTNPGKILEAWDRRVAKDGYGHALGETVTDVIGYGKGAVKIAGKVGQGVGEVAKAAAREAPGFIKDTAEAGNTIANELK